VVAAVDVVNRLPQVTEPVVAVLVVFEPARLRLYRFPQITR
jgi:hypothetical protein